MKRLTIFVLFILALSVSLSAQDDVDLKAQEPKKETKKQQPSKIYYGGTLGVSFGSYSSIRIEPLIAYKITPKFHAGLKVGYQYASYDNHTMSNYGASVLARYRVIPVAYLHAEYSTWSIDYRDPLGRQTVPFLLLGAGYSPRLGPNTWGNIEVLWDVLNDNMSPYENGSPFVSIGVGVGF